MTEKNKAQTSLENDKAWVLAGRIIDRVQLDGNVLHRSSIADEIRRSSMINNQSNTEGLITYEDLLKMSAISAPLGKISAGTIWANEPGPGPRENWIVGGDKPFPLRLNLLFQTMVITPSKEYRPAMHLEWMPTYERDVREMIIEFRDLGTETSMTLLNVRADAGIYTWVHGVDLGELYEARCRLVYKNGESSLWSEWLSETLI